MASSFCDTALRLLLSCAKAIEVGDLKSADAFLHDILILADQRYYSCHTWKYGWKCNIDAGEMATPKQIRELMQVDSLTNDEVKSHLQFGESSKGSSSQSGSPQGPLQLATNTGGTSTIACESMEDDEDAKFETAIIVYSGILAIS
ncbi:hypothetical protein GOBAR_AA35959 [Gossypium barbadense]|uniref:Uncharacterized protein n=1 Tax=Gossypium barbadense TaxID=3634 RepID=A0A2P5W100_GOSBA|nr:hypothetical protein GOBAR_AA35959 [Gossypium barbadense]